MVLKAVEKDLKSGLKRVCSYQEFMALTATKEKAREERLRSVRAALTCRHEIRMSKELPKQAAIVYEKENAIRDTMKDLQKKLKKKIEPTCCIVKKQMSFYLYQVIRYCLQKLFLEKLGSLINYMV